MKRVYERIFVKRDAVGLKTALREFVIIIIQVALKRLPYMGMNAISQIHEVQRVWLDDR